MTRPARNADTVPNSGSKGPRGRTSSKPVAQLPDARPLLSTAEGSASGSSAERSLRVLALLASEGRALSLADLAARLALPKGTAHRICSQLLVSGYLARDVDERLFSVGPALRKLAFDTLNHGVVRGMRHEVLSELVRQVGETCNFTTLDGAQVLYLDRVEAQWPLRLTLEVGSHVPLHCTASGKLLLAHLQPAARDALIDKITLSPMTAKTITSRDKLRAECEAIAQRGFASDDEEFIAGLVAIAVPVLGSDGRARAAIAVHAPTARMSLAQAVACHGALQKAAQRMSDFL